MRRDYGLLIGGSAIAGALCGVVLFTILFEKVEYFEGMSDMEIFLALSLSIPLGALGFVAFVLPFVIAHWFCYGRYLSTSHYSRVVSD